MAQLREPAPATPRHARRRVGRLRLALRLRRGRQPHQLLHHGRGLRRREHGQLGPHAHVAAGDRGRDPRRAARCTLAGQIDLSKSIYVRPNFTWLSYIVGGFLFGVGMTLGSGCGSKTLVRVGGGSLKSVVVFVFLGDLGLHDAEGAVRDLAHCLARSGRDRPRGARNGAGQDLPTLLAAGDRRERAHDAGSARRSWSPARSLVFVFKDREFRASFDHILGGVVIGLHDRGRLVCHRPPGLRGEPRHAREHVLRDQQPHHRVALVHGAGGLPRSSC